MMLNYQIFNMISEYTEHQQGYVLRKQLLDAGMSDETFAELAGEDGLLVRADEGIYRMRGTPVYNGYELNYFDWLKLSLEFGPLNVSEPLVIASHNMAAYLLDLFPRSFSGPHFTARALPEHLKNNAEIFTADFGREDYTYAYGMPVTRPLRTFIDILAQMEVHEYIGDLAFRILGSGAVTPRRLAEAIAPYSAMYFETEFDGPEFLENLLLESKIYAPREIAFWVQEARLGTI